MCGTLQARERLQLGGTPVGLRTYLAVGGGFQTRPLLGSRSRESRLEAGELLPAVESRSAVRHPAEVCWTPPTASPFRVVAGPDAPLCDRLDDWLGSSVSVTGEADRMGIRLEGPSLSARVSGEFLSKPISPGAVQAAGGVVLLLGVACGTMGGYPHVAQVISADLDRIGQLRPGDRLTFRRVSVAEARGADRDHRRLHTQRRLRYAALARDFDWSGRRSD
jgi:allophanate hydrolase subunit 2